MCMPTMWVCLCAEIRLWQCSPLSLFLHVCSTCSSHISANIYTGCKTLLISLACLLSCSFSQPTLTLTFFHPDWEWQEGGYKESGGRKRASECRGRSGEERREQGESLWWRERKRPASEREASKGSEERVFSVMDDLSSYRNQKPNQPSSFLAKAHNALVQGGPLG